VAPSAPRDRVVETLIRTLAPYIGQNMAGSAVRMQIEKLGLSDQHLGDAQIDALLTGLAPALNVFIGRITTKDALDKVRDALRTARRSNP
jgi:hypothetical protein